jgi:hypothetical protein
MTAFNIVKFRVKPGEDEAFLKAHRDGKARWPGLSRGVIVKTGERSYCLIGEWPNAEAITQARAAMIATLGGFRGVLEDIGEGKGVTDAASGVAVLDLMTA